MFHYAITRRPHTNFAEGLTTVDLGKPDYNKMIEQYGYYIQTLRNLNLNVVVLPSLPDYPDSYFVEDVAVVVPELAIITRPGAKSRIGEVDHIGEALRQHYKKTPEIKHPGTLDGGDLFVVDKNVYVGLSKRTNINGAEQLRKYLEPFGYVIFMIDIGIRLHLKTSVNYIGQNRLLLTEDFVDEKAFKSFDHLIVDSNELAAANTLLINDHLLTPKGYPKTLAKLKHFNSNIIELDMSEIEKMDGGVSCLSLRF